MSRFQIEVPSDPSFLRIVRASVEIFCSMAGMNEEESCQVVLAVAEACANIIRHSYEGEVDKPIICEGRVEDGVILFVLRDFGKKVDPSKICPRELSDVRPGGLGVHFIREVMDSMVFEDRGEDGTWLILRKRLRGPAERG